MITGQVEQLTNSSASAQRLMIESILALSAAQSQTVSPSSPREQHPPLSLSSIARLWADWGTMGGAALRGAALRVRLSQPRRPESAACFADRCR